MKVVILHPPLYPMNHKLFNILGRHIDLVVYSFGEYPKLHTNWNIYKFQREAKYYKIKVFGVGTTGNRKQFSAKAFFELIGERADVVMSVAFWVPSLYASSMKRFLKFKFVIITDAILETEKNISNLKKLYRKILCSNTDMVISASSLTTKYIQTLSSKTQVKESIQTIDVCLWTETINLLPDKTTLRHKLNLPIDKKILLGVGNFIEKKNWEYVLENIKYIEDTIFLLIGGGELEDSYRQYIQLNRLEERVIILSRKEGVELIRFFKASDVFIFPSLYDQFGYVVLEALCSGLPVICSNRTGACTLIQDRYNGFLVDPCEKITDCVHYLVQNNNKMAINSQNSVKNLTINKKATEYLNLLNEITEE